MQEHKHAPDPRSLQMLGRPAGLSVGVWPDTLLSSAVLVLGADAPGLDMMPAW